MKPAILRSATAALFVLLILFASSAVTYADAIYQPSSWAAQRVEICKQAGIIPEGFEARPFTENITRRDFCQLLVNACRIYGLEFPELPENPPFTDTTDAIAGYSYVLGLTQGTAKGIFSPEMQLTREMAAAMLSRVRMLFHSVSQNENKSINWNTSKDTAKNSYGSVYATPENTLAYTLPLSQQDANKLLEEYSEDYSLVSGWATAYMADVYSLGILSGTGGGKLDPGSNIIREQAAILVLNLLGYYDDTLLKASGIEECVIPKPTGIYISPSYKPQEVFLRWNDIPSASAYDITIIKNGTPAFTSRISASYLDLRNTGQPSRSGDRTQSLYSEIFGSSKQQINATIKITPINADGAPSLFSLQQEFYIASQLSGNELITGDPARNQFANAGEALKNMSDITVNVWQLTASGSKQPSTLTFKINKNVADTVKKIFQDIFNGEEKFPIKSIIGYAYRDGQSQHSNGTAIDINYEENYFISSSGSILAGKLWKPGVNPYSIPPNGDIVRAFNRYGWHWSPDMNWSNGKDYMHFSLTGK